MGLDPSESKFCLDPIFCVYGSARSDRSISLYQKSQEREAKSPGEPPNDSILVRQELKTPDDIRLPLFEKAKKVRKAQKCADIIIIDKDTRTYFIEFPE